MDLPKSLAIWVTKSWASPHDESVVIDAVEHLLTLLWLLVSSSSFRQRVRPMPIAKSVYIAGFAGGAVLIAAMIGIVTLQIGEFGQSTAPSTGTQSKGARPTDVQTDDNPQILSPSAGRAAADRPDTGSTPQVGSPAPALNSQQEHGAQGKFDHARYKAADLDEVIGLARPEIGADIYPVLPLKIAVALISYGEPCNTGFLKQSMFMMGQKDVVENVPITSCIKVRSAKGKTVPLYIQDRVAEFLPKEVPLGRMVALYVSQVYISPDGPALLVNDFSVGSAANGCICGPANFHPGTDYTAPQAGMPVPAADAGVVVKIETNELALVDVSDIGHCGRYVVMKHAYPNGRSVFTRYAQLGRLVGDDGRPIAVGSRVVKRGKIGEVGSSNLFHFEIRPVERSAMDSSAAWVQRYGADPTMEWSRYRIVDPATFDFTEFGRTGTSTKAKTGTKKTQ